MEKIDKENENIIDHNEYLMTLPIVNPPSDVHNEFAPSELSNESTPSELPNESNPSELPNEYTQNISKLFIHLFKGLYNPSDEVTGCIYLEAKETIPNAAIFLKLKGIEKVKYPSNIDPAEILKSQKYYFNHIFKIYHQRDNLISKGMYEFPFKFLLPSNIPNNFSMNLEDKATGCYAQITYTAKAFLQCTYNSDIFTSEKDNPKKSRYLDDKEE